MNETLETDELRSNLFGVGIGSLNDILFVFVIQSSLKLNYFQNVGKNKNIYSLLL